MAGGYPGTAWLRSISGRSAGKVRSSTQRLVSPMGEGSTAASQGFAAGMCCISVRAAAGALGALRPDRFYTVFTHECPLALCRRPEHPGLPGTCQTAAETPTHSEMHCLIRGLCI